MERSTFFILSFFLMLSFAAAESSYTVYQNGTTANYSIVCLNDAYCSASAYCNLNIIQPDSSKTLLVSGQNMTNNGNYHNYTITPIYIGKHRVGGYCQDGTSYQEIDTFFFVTTTGEILSTGEAVLYLILMTGLVITFAFLFYWMLRLKFGNFFDYETGELLGRNDMKYVKMFLIPVNYVILAWIFGIARSIAANYLMLAGVERFFNWAYWIMMYLSIPLLITTLYFIIIWVINDKKINEALKRGSPYNGP